VYRATFVRPPRCDRTARRLLREGSHANALERAHGSVGIVVFVANADRMPARVTRPRHMCYAKRCEVGTQSVFDTGAVRLLRAAAVAFVVRLG
jgi:hypothetical protein